MQNQHPRSFQGIWIPKEIWNHPSLLLIEKILLSQCEQERGAFICPDINFLENFFSLSKNIILKHIKRLRVLGLEIKFSSSTHKKNQTKFLSQTVCIGRNNE